MFSPSSGKYKVIGSVQRALDILALFNNQTTRLGITEMSELLGLHKSTVAGLVYTLEQNGYLDQDSATRKYGLGLKLVERAFVVLNQIEVRQMALPHLQELRDWCDESVNLAIRDEQHVVYIERLLGTQTLGMRAEVGKRAPVHSTALGKAILSCLPPSEVQKFIAQYGLPPVTPRTITDPERFFEELDQIRERGFAIDNEEDELGGRCVAAPIFDHTGRPVAAVSISVPASRLPMSEVGRFGERVRDTAKAISRSLGYLPRPY